MAYCPNASVNCVGSPAPRINATRPCTGKKAVALCWAEPYFIGAVGIRSIIIFIMVCIISMRFSMA